jgi:hypothetical protein
LGYWDPLDLCRSKVIDEECNVPAAKDPGEAERAENEYDEQSFKKESAHRSLRWAVKHRQRKLWGAQAASLR